MNESYLQVGTAIMYVCTYMHSSTTMYIPSMKSAAAPELYCAGLLFDLKKAAAAQLF